MSKLGLPSRRDAALGLCHMVQVDTGRFLNELGRLFEKAKAKDSVRVTLKRSEYTLRTNVLSCTPSVSFRGHYA